tara:strand:+ start:385 stop:978 length:594 start_codon:yes stop_codon:yes gene_type:complete
MASVLEIINGISQVMANAYDGATDENGEPIKVGLKREEGHPIHDSRVMDGFKVKMYPGQIAIHYHAEVKLKDIHGNGFESDIDSMIGDIAKFLKKEFKKVTGSALNLKPTGEVKITAQSTSKVRNWVEAHRFFDCSGLKGLDKIKAPSEDRLEDNFKSFLSQGGWSGEGKDTKGVSVYTGKGKVKTRKDIHSSYKAE